MTAIWRRELQGYFHTAIGYVFMGVFLAASSVLFFLQILRQRSGDLLTFIGQMSYLWMLLSPVLTMRLLADDRQKRTDQLLLTSPVSVTGIVLGKYFAAVMVLLLTVLLTGAFAGIVAMYGTVYPGEMAVGYLGFVLEGCAFVAMDLFLSGCAANQVTAAVLAFGANFAVWMMDLLADAVSAAWLRNVLDFFSLYGRNEPFLMGQLSFAGVFYDLSFAAVFIVLTIYRLDARRYRGA